MTYVISDIHGQKDKFDTMESAVVLNDYETFIDKVYHTIMAQ